MNSFISDPIFQEVLTTNQDLVPTITTVERSAARNNLLMEARNLPMAMMEALTGTTIIDAILTEIATALC